MRTFIAVEIPKDIQKKIGDYVSSINGNFRFVRWVAPHNLHFTIKFLGEVNNSSLDDLKDCVAKTASENNPFWLNLNNTGFFPSQRKPRVIWVGADSGADNLLMVFQSLENHLEKIGFDREVRAFSPHMTIGRVRKDKKISAPESLPEFEQESFLVSSLALIKSTLTPKGPVYETIHKSDLEQ